MRSYAEGRSILSTVPMDFNPVFSGHPGEGHGIHFGHVSILTGYYDQLLWPFCRHFRKNCGVVITDLGPELGNSTTMVRAMMDHPPMTIAVVIMPTADELAEMSRTHVMSRQHPSFGINLSLAMSRLNLAERKISLLLCHELPKENGKVPPAIGFYASTIIECERGVDRNRVTGTIRKTRAATLHGWRFDTDLDRGCTSFRFETQSNEEPKE